MSLTSLGARVTGSVPVTRETPIVPARVALGYAGIVAVILLAARHSLADHLGAPRIGLVTPLAVAAVTALVVALVGVARRPAAHLAGALALLAAGGIALAYRFSTGDGRHQMAAAAAAAAVFVAVTVAGRRAGGWMRLRRIRLALGAAGMALIAAPALPGLGQARGGARLFVHLPGLTAEPGLLGAVLITVAVASGLAADGDLLALAGPRTLRDAPAALLSTGTGAAIAIGLTVLAHDLGSALVLSAALIVCLAAGTHRMRYPAAVAAALAVGAAIAWPHLAYVSVRFANWAHPLAAGPGGGITQVAAARYALAWGGLLGRGLGSGAIHGSAALPAASSDYAIVQLSSETGVMAALGVLAALAIAAAASWALVGRARAGDDQLVGTGAAVLLTAPALLLIAGVSGVAPLTGTPVPLFEIGASAAVTAAVAAGLLAGAASDDLAIDHLTPVGGFARLRNFPVLAALASVLVLAVAAMTLVDEATDTRLTRTASSPYLLASAPVLRGSILTADGTVLAESTGTGSLDTAARHYPATSIDGVDISGVAVPRESRTGLEASEDPQLRCGAAATVPGSLDNPAMPAGADPARCAPADIVTTISAPVQRAAVRALDGVRGVAVVIDADTGALLAMAASPAASDPNSVVTPNVGTDMARLASSPPTLAGTARSPLFTPATSLGEAPGSLYKLLLGPAYAAAHLTPGIAPGTSSIPVVSRDGTLGTLRNAGGETCGGDLTETLTVSCDTAAAELAQAAGRSAMTAAAAELGLTTPAAVSGEPVTRGVLGLAAHRSQAQAAAEAARAGTLDADLAMSAIGQASVRLTPMSVATLGAEIITGRRVYPYLAAAVCRAGQTLAGHTPRPGPVIPGTGLDLAGMAGAISSAAGTAHGLLAEAAPVARDLVAAKTGTAQLPGGDQIAWMLAAVHYAGAAGRTAVVATMVLPAAADRQPVGAVQAAAVAGPILDAAATHPPAPATITAGAGLGTDTAVCSATKPAGPPRRSTPQLSGAPRDDHAAGPGRA
jgi:cell division protein FtsW (lipid II flippase)